MDSAEYSGLRQFLLSQKPRKDRVHREVPTNASRSLPAFHGLSTSVMGVQRRHVQRLPKIPTVRQGTVRLSHFTLSRAVTCGSSVFQMRRNFKVLPWHWPRVSRPSPFSRVRHNRPRHSQVSSSLPASHPLIDAHNRRPRHHRWLRFCHLCHVLWMSLDDPGGVWHDGRQRLAPAPASEWIRAQKGRPDAKALRDV